MDAIHSPFERMVPLSAYAERRAQLASTLAGGIAIISASSPKTRANDTEYTYRQASDFYYLTGFNEPSATLVIDARTNTPAYTLFLRPRDAKREQWDGYRVGVENARNALGVDNALDISELEQALPKLFDGAAFVALNFRTQHTDEGAIIQKVFSAIDRLKRGQRNGRAAPNRLRDLEQILGRQRLYKSADEIAATQKAIAITGMAHRAAMALAEPGMREYALEAEILKVFRANGAAGPAYNAIVGTGVNATVLHYPAGSATLNDGDLVLIDAGAEFDGYAGDITRTFPVNGKFSDAQRRIYEIVLSAQQKSISAIKKDAHTLEDIHTICAHTLAEGLIDLKLLNASTAEEAIESKELSKFYPHRTSHWLGLDVHDAGPYFEYDESSDAYVPLQLTPGMIFTIEPGLYFPEADDVPEAYRGIGIRIEDDILITESGYENLSTAIPKTIGEVEDACAAP